MGTQAYYNRNTGLVRLEGETGPVINELTGDPITGATAEITEILDSAGSPIGGATFPIAMAESNPGYYYAMVPAELAVTTGDDIKIISKMVSGNAKGDWRTPCKVVDQE